MMRLAIASGKGGTGKSTVSLNLARSFDLEIQLLDCDVEEPNDHLFLRSELLEEEVITLPIPEVDAALCDSCGKCSSFCEFGAIVLLGSKPTVFPPICHGCGGCSKVCPRGAIKEVENRIGTVERSRSGKITLIQGKLDIGMAMAPPLIKAVRSHLREDLPAILDSPPGTSCSAVATLQGSDIALLVTEPTPFGLHDLKIAVEMVRELKLPMGVVINRMGIGDDRIHRFCEEEQIPIWAEIPDDRRIAEAYSRGELIVDALPEYRPLFIALKERVLEVLQ